MVSPLTYVKKGWLMFEANLVFRFRCLECVDILYLDCDDSKLDDLTPVILYMVMVSWLSLTSTSSHSQLIIFNLYFQSWSADYLYFRSWSADHLNLDFQSWSADYLQPLLQVMETWLSLTSIWSWLAAYLCSWILGLDSDIWHTWHTWCTMM